MKSPELAAYYAARAPEYDRLYERPERQEDLSALRQVLIPRVAGLRVLELACGTGYWTDVAGEVAASVTATDIGSEMMELARARNSSRSNVRFEFMDAYNLGDLAGRYDAVVAGYWWSHILRGHLPNFLAGLARSVGPGVCAIFMDNLFVQGSSTPIHRTDSHGNTYQLRRLADGRQCEVLKNFPDESEARRAIGDSGEGFRFVTLRYYWFLSYVTK